MRTFCGVAVVAKKGVAKMRLIITNNKKVNEYFKGKADIVEVDSDKEVFEEGMKIVSKGGRLLHDPLKGYGCYRSLVFTTDGSSIPAEKSVDLLKKCSDKIAARQNKPTGKDPIFAGILQNHDLNCIKSL